MSLQDELINFFAPTSLIGTAGQPTAAQFASIAAQGYGAVVNLAMPDSDNALANEGAIVTSLGLSYFHIPVPFDNPTANHLRQFSGVMDTLADDKVFVHCAVNARVSAFTFQYLTLVRDMAPDTVTSPLLARWRAEMAPAWQQFMAIDKASLRR